ncbi:DNA polymerase III subunits gamma and tau domain III [Musa troglodytarum]|uniref:DNA polymerase III subunits gamma and tau domain III n=1 Tax=Musa troglodytarum TaxID=320322 RepID=A0A9E7HZW0_9LILI|nr:DNA polymerase III subunits gamma and tau domain III [Musa troglodytarum]
MVENCVGPSELHLKKELTALRKARFLRDPETCSSWRSHVSSRSFIATSSLNYGNGTIGSIAAENNNDVSEKISKVYLCNWRHYSTKSNENGDLDDEGKQLSVMETSEDNISNHHCVDSMSDTYPEFPLSVYKLSGANSEAPCGRTDRNSRSSILKKGVIKHSTVSTLLDTGSSSLGILNSGEQSDDTENCISEDLHQLKHELSKKKCYRSCSASPLISESGYGNLSCSSKIFRTTVREGSSQSCTPTSTNSYYKYGAQNPSIIDSCDGTAASFDGDELDQPDFPKGQGCGMTCYWSKGTKYRGTGGLYSPSLSDTLKRKGSSILCGSQSLRNKKRSSGSQKQKYISACSQGLPLLANSCDEGSSSLDTASDELSTKLGELDLEAVSRLDGRRWSSCKSHDGLELAAPGDSDLEIVDKRSLSHKYQPRSFDEVIGQNIVVQSLSNAILRGRVAPAYLFQGPRGTGKTSIARIFSAALNCLSKEDKKPCWLCRECTAFSNRSRTNMNEVNATNKKGLDKFRYLLKNLSLSKATSQYKVFVIDECHMLSPKIWSSFMKFLEEPMPCVVFIFITIDPENLPHSIVSRCQKYVFSKVKDIDIICRLRKLSEQENLDVELGALDLIALNSDGSPRDAETTLDQLSLLGKRITTSLVNDLVGVVSDDKLLDLLEIAMSSNNAETVKKSRELMDSGVDPIALMSQLAGLIMDIIAGTYELTNLQSHDTPLGKRSLTEAELERLRQALKILSDAEKQLRHSSERSTWFTAALLQLSAGHNLESTQSSNNTKRSTRGTDDVVSDMVCDSRICEIRTSLDGTLTDSGPTGDATDMKVYKYVSLDKLDEIWRRCIDGCHSRTLRQLLYDHARLASITENDGTLVALIAFEDDKIKTRAERFLSSITNSFEIVFRRNVEVRMVLATENSDERNALSRSPAGNSVEKDNQNMIELDTTNGLSSKDRCKGTTYLPGKRLGHSDSSVTAEGCIVAGIPSISAEGKNDSCLSEDQGQLDSTQSFPRAATDEQKLESAWLRAAEKYTPEIISHSRPEKNQVLPQNGVIYQNNNQPFLGPAATSKNKVDELKHEIQALKVSYAEGSHKGQIGGAGQCVVSPSLLHSNTTNADKNSGYESGPVCNGLLCWKTQKKIEGRKSQVKQGVRVRSKKISHIFHCLDSVRS